MANHNFVIEDIGQGKIAEEFRESFINSIILVFGLNFTLKSIYHVNLFGLMVSPCHVKNIFIDTFPGNKGHDTLYRERSTVDKISIEEIFVVHMWVTVYFKDVKDIVVLPMNIPAYGNLFLIIYFVLN